ncbi:MAG: hypothetical protein AAF629_15535 [Chloroflexota bacterium]
MEITQLIDWLEGRLAPDEASEVETIVQNDDELQKMTTWLQGFLNASHTTILVDPPAGLFEKTAMYFKDQTKLQAGPNWIERLVASLNSDSWQRPALAGVRQAGLQTLPRQLVYSTDVADVALHIQAARRPNQRIVLGQIFPINDESPDSFTVQLLQQFNEIALVYSDDMGKFTFPNLQGDVYSLVILGEQIEIVINDIEVGA